jgi:hypothetical protein
MSDCLSFSFHGYAKNEKQIMVSHAEFVKGPPMGIRKAPENDENRKQAYSFGL